jgi:hypothetical protein
VISHVTGDIRSEPAVMAEVEYRKMAPGATLRGRPEILRFFDRLDLLDPGLVQVPLWRPDGPESPGTDKVWVLGGVGRKPAPRPTERM